VSADHLAQVVGALPDRQALGRLRLVGVVEGLLAVHAGRDRQDVGASGPGRPARLGQEVVEAGGIADQHHAADRRLGQELADAAGHDREHRGQHHDQHH
jgi:hypothetical protein